MVRAVLALALLAAGLAANASDLRAFDAGSMQTIKAAHAGSPFVVAFWSIHCAPCIEEMPDWRALRQRYPDVPILLVATDSPTERARVAQMLAKYPPGKVETWAFADDFSERIRYSVDPGWRGELPRTYLYDSAHAVEVISGRLDRQRVDAWFARLR